MSNVEYSESAIRSVSDVDHMRMRPTAYVTSIGSDGVVHVIREILDNSFDELGAISDKDAEIHLTIFRCYELNEVIIIVKDTGRGIPLGKVKDSFTKARTSGKFNREVYKQSAGLLGVGGKVVFSFSKEFRAIVSREGYVVDMPINYTNFHEREPAKHVIDVVPHARESFTHGTITITRPDTKIFVNMEEFLNEGVDNLLTLLKIIDYFCGYKMYMHVINVSPEKFKEYNKVLFDTTNGEINPQFTDDTLKFIDDVNDQPINLFYTPSNKMNRESQIRELFSLAQWREVITFNKPFENIDDPLYVDFKAYLGSKHHETSTCTLSVVNNIIFRNHDDSHIAEFRKALKQAIGPLIKDNDVRNFFMTKYIFPFYYVVHVKFTDAEFTGTTKDKFVDEKFKKVYSRWLTEYFEKHKEDIVKVFQLVEKDVISKFKNVRDNGLGSKMSNLTAQLNYPANFRDCLEYGEEAEMFICEGKSATRVDSRDSKFQSIYGLFGKPFNSITSKEETDKSLNALLKNRLFQDIFTIIGVKPNDPTLEGLRFHKIFLTTDADEHGKHIANIILANLYIYNPDLIKQGKVYVTLPPLYKLSLNGKDFVFAKNQEEYVQTLVEEVYSKQYNFSMMDTQTLEMTNLKKNDLITLAENIFEIGNMIENIAKENNIPIHVMEALLVNQLTESTLPSYTDEQLRGIFKARMVKFDVESKVLIISYDDTDIIIYMGSLQDTKTEDKIIFKDIVEKYKTYQLDNKLFKIVDKRSTSKQKESGDWVNPMFVYNFLEGINKKYTSKKLKGLGSMDPEDMFETCMHPETRYDYQITNMTDIENIFKYLGSDPVYRKLLVSTDTNS